MPTLTQQDLRAMLKCLQELHVACDLEALPTRAVSALSVVVSADIANWCPTNFHHHRVFWQTMSGSTFLKPQAVDHTVHRHFLEHPYARHYLTTRDGSAHTISDFLSEQEFHRLEGLYQGVMRLIDMEDQLSFVLPVSSEEKDVMRDNVEDVVVALMRPKRDFTERDRLMVNLLRPHLIQAYLNARTITQLQHQAAALNQRMDQLGVIVLSANHQVLTMPPRAWQLLIQYFPTSAHSVNALPDTLQRWVNYQLSLKDSNELNSPYLPLRVEQEHGYLTVRLVGDRPHEQYLLLLEEQPRRSFAPEPLEAIGLTKREAEVLFWSAQDKTTKEIAATLKCSSKTVEKHFEHLYAKLGVQTRTAALAKALERLGIAALRLLH
jgi:DNA-binding CsgD family transcriptional regulator